jgi:hypothetical protein
VPNETSRFDDVRSLAVRSGLGSRAQDPFRRPLISQVEGGMKGTTCVVSARVMLLPLTPTVKAVLFRPQKTATAFDAAVNSSTDACKAMAKDKLKEATEAVVSALVKT